MRQQTIRKALTFEGVGLHSGQRARVTLSPAPPDAGIIFHTAGVAERIPAGPESVVDSLNATTVGVNGTRIRTIEHLLAAAAGLGIDNLDVEVEGVEIPALDGSARPFVQMLASVGRAPQSARRPLLTVPYPIRVGGGNRWIQVLPADVLRVSYTLDSDHAALGTQVLALTPTEHAFVDEIAPARTYGFLKDIGMLRKKGLARGGSLDNTVVIGDRGPLNSLRFRDECVRHKILDLIGDLALLGRPLAGHVVARNGGHALNLELVLAIQRALGLERRPAGAVVRVLGRPVPVTGEGLRPVPAV
jgi:UDP-3-O-[3-hydroxymyristoyl] N-acetylglucosamine deacetylase